MNNPIILGLFKLLPAPGTKFPKDKRAVWLKAAAINLDLIYGEEPGEDAVTQASPATPLKDFDS
jgi:hypothetical protein